MQNMLDINVKARMIRNNIRGEDAGVDEILNNPQGELAKKFNRALISWENRLRRSYIESARMASSDLDHIARTIEIPRDQLEIYYEYFFDIEGWDRLDKIEHIERVGEKHKTEALLKMWTMTQGLDFLAWRLGKKVNISPVEGLIDLFSTCIFKSKEAMFNGSGTEAGNESIKWTKQSTDIGRLLKMWVMDSAAAKKDLEIAIREIVPEFGSIDEILADDDIVMAAIREKEASESAAYVEPQPPVIPDIPGFDDLK